MTKMFKTYSQKPAEVERSWYLIDASEAPLGRLAVAIADKLMGKSKVTYTPHTDNGDFVVVINAAKTVVTGNKEEQKKYYRHSGYMGGLTETTLGKMRKETPERIIISAVYGMLPKNKLQADRLQRLKIFPGAEHAHAAQKPQKVEVK
ncbi:MAG: 50S ribosomal protein L13 [Candidatus Nomurabacteria bacterium]|jgi:large subunit ribosomal protein L13|nr:50S ribosomal protein L13 [Candidatus Nomurabacteria bacterium]